MTTVLDLRDVAKSFGEVRAVDGVSFAIRAGTITGLLGRNGAGKTTTLRMVNGIFLPDRGAIEVLGGLMLVPGLLTMRGLGVKRVAVIDGTARLRDAITGGLAAPADAGAAPANRRGRPAELKEPALRSLIAPEYVDAEGRDADGAAKPYLERLYSERRDDRLDGVLVIPAKAFADPSAALTYFSRSSTDLMVESMLGRLVNNALQRQRLAARGVDPAEIDTLLKDTPIRSVQLTKGGERKAGGKMNFLVGLVKEAQQVLGPLMIVMMVPWFVMSPILMSPDSTLATVLSLIPVYTPITMFIRVLVSEPPLWQLLLSVGLSGATLLALLWATAKIFRLGLLAYGKRPTIPELWRWLKLA